MAVMMKIQEYQTDLQRWQAVVGRESAADGKFVYGVLTTGIYCRPTCSSRQPRQENVRFFDTWQAAEQAGFRACKRCSPRLLQEPAAHHEAVIRACRALEEAEQPPTLGELAREAGLSLYHFQRVFRKTVGLTPRQYYQEKRLERMRAGLRQEPTITQAIYQAGYGSSGRFYREDARRMGMRPSIYRRGGEGVVMRYAIEECYLGRVLVAATDQGICTIAFGDNPAVLEAELRARFPRAVFAGPDPQFGEWVQRVLAFLDAPREGLDLPLDIQGTAFQRRVWAALRAIPAGTHISYSELAGRIGAPKAVRAVAQACASNKIAVAIPCHRVVRSNGDLAGYRWGVERKRILLEKERGDV